MHESLVRAHLRRLAFRSSRMVYPWVDLHPDRKLHSLHSGVALDPEDLIRSDVAAEAARAGRRCTHWSATPASWTTGGSRNSPPGTAQTRCASTNCTATPRSPRS
ncbi:hypothetical protein BN6_68270 [Saccharothrix espanaensis DSM 44229]|uniref:Uncharacterized protein n=1 Tax=Saccharothrix espanaensis (strain ATCC 51144 / DSM 44229 / JCM 9112 / NBRC 15066 / NRRL 15764) TaxID=1179773 RepID=K0KB81_SACES|nr:hypothetical protein BN6_68270 [Saccharothrix espanaensis DSM 44229]